MKLQLQSRRGEEEEEEEEEGEEGEERGEGAAPGPTWAPPETQDFQEYLAENERAVLHLQTAEELERLKAEEDSGPGGEGGGLCVLGEHLDGTTWQVKPPPGPSQFPSVSPVLCCFPTEQGAQGGAQPYLAEAPPGLPWQVQPQPGGKGGNVEPPAPTSTPSGKHLGVPPANPAESKGGAPQNPPEHLEHPEHLEN
ncbi:CSRN2 protein, partial [Tachuris rubrigastra]|nr:CSRN2 protein [Tachuris rubrigastra]